MTQIKGGQAFRFGVSAGLGSIIVIVLLCTAFMLIGGYKHETMTGMWFCIQGVFWFLFGMVFLLMARFNQIKLDLLKEIKRVELAVMELKEAMGAKQK